MKRINNETLHMLEQNDPTHIYTSEVHMPTVSGDDVFLELHTITLGLVQVLGRTLILNLYMLISNTANGFMVCGKTHLLQL